MKNNEKYRLRTNVLLSLLFILAVPFSTGAARARSLANPPQPAVITPQNVSGLALLARMGEGVVTGDFALQPGGTLIASITGAGVALLDSASGAQTAFIDLGFGPTALAISPDGKTLAVLFNVRTGQWVESAAGRGVSGPGYAPHVRFFSLPDGKPSGSEIADLKECGQSNIWALAFSPDGKELLFERKYSNVDTARRFCAVSVADGRVARKLELPAGSSSNLDPSGRYFVAFSIDKDGKPAAATVYSAQTLKPVAELAFPSASWPEAAFTSRGDYLAVSYYAGETEKSPHTLQLWSLPGGEPAFTILEDETHTAASLGAAPQEVYDRITALDVSADGSRVATGSQNGKVKVWNAATGKLEKEIAKLVYTSLSQVENPGGVGAEQMPSPVKHLVFAADGKSLVASDYPVMQGQQGQLHVYQLPGGSETAAFYGSAVSAIDFSPDSAQVALAGFADGRVELRRALDASLAQTLRGHTARVNQVRYAKTGDLIATASDDLTVRLWDVKTGKELKALKGHTARVNQVSFSPDGKWLVSGADDNTIRRWDAASGSPIETLQLGDENWRVDFLAALPDGVNVFYLINKYPSPYTGYITKQVVWNTQSGAQTLIGDGKTRLSALSGDGQAFVGYSTQENGWIVGRLQADGAMSITASGIRSPYGNGALVLPVLSPDNRLLVTGNFAGLHAYDVSGSSASFTGLVAQAEPIPSYGESTVFSPDGKVLAMAAGGVVYLLGVPLP